MSSESCGRRPFCGPLPFFDVDQDRVGSLRAAKVGRRPDALALFSAGC
jgi:hypothetical protein